jgi:hypothetical protein
MFQFTANSGLMTTSAADQFLDEVCHHAHHVSIYCLHAFHITLVFLARQVWVANNDRVH